METEYFDAARALAKQAYKNILPTFEGKTAASLVKALRAEAQRLLDTDRRFFAELGDKTFSKDLDDNSSNGSHFPVRKNVHFHATSNDNLRFTLPGSPKCFSVIFEHDPEWYGTDEIITILYQAADSYEF